MTQFYNKTTLLSTEDSLFIETSTLDVVDVLICNLFSNSTTLSIALSYTNKTRMVLETRYCYVGPTSGQFGPAPVVVMSKLDINECLEAIQL